MTEIWKNVENYKGIYQISSKGRVKSLRRKRKPYGYLAERILKNRPQSTGYNAVHLCKDGLVSNVNVHRLVAEAFIYNSDNKVCVNHKDGIKINNKVGNLEWCSYSENMKHAYNKLGRPRIELKGELNGRALLTNKKVHEIRTLLKETKFSQQKIAKMYKISQPVVSCIKLNKLWRDVNLNA